MHVMKPTRYVVKYKLLLMSLICVTPTQGTETLRSSTQKWWCLRVKVLTDAASIDHEFFEPPRNCLIACCDTQERSEAVT